MKKIFPKIILFSIFLFSCASDSENTNTDDALDPSFLVGVNVAGDFFQELEEGSIYASDQNGQIIAQGPLMNNTTTNLEAIFDINTTYDFSILIRQGNLITLKTFKNVSPETYTLTEKTIANPNADQLDVRLFNTGSPFEVIAPSTFSAIISATDGGSIEFDTQLQISPGDFYGAFLNQNEAIPRYLFMENVSKNNFSQHDYTTLPFLENVHTLVYPNIDALRLKIIGFRTFNDQNIAHDFFSKTYDTPRDVLTIHSPDAVFDSFRVNSQITSGSNTYTITSFGAIENKTISVPNLDLTISSDAISNFNANTSGNYNYYEISFSDFLDTTNTLVFHRIYGKQTETISLENETLFNAVFQDEPSIEAANMNINKAILNRNSFESDFNTTIQNRIEDLFLYPDGTEIITIQK